MVTAPGWRGINEFIDPLQKGHGIAIVIAAIAVGQPFAGFARIIEVEHRGDGIDAKPIDVVAIEPEQRIGREKRRDFAAAKIIDRRIPIRMEPKARVGMFVKRLAVELREPVNVGWEMRGDPQSRITPRPAACALSTKRANEAGSPKRRVGAKSPIGS